MLCWSWSVVVVEVVVECCCCIPYRLALMLVLTFAPCACGVILLLTSASTPLPHMVVVTGSNLRWWHFPSAIGSNTPCTGGGVTCCNLRWWFFPSTHWRTYSTCAQATLHCVVVVCGGGSCMWCGGGGCSYGVVVVYIIHHSQRLCRLTGEVTWTQDASNYLVVHTLDLIQIYSCVVSKLSLINTQ